MPRSEKIETPTISSAVTTLNFPAIMGVTIFGACCYILLNLLADIIIALDPRVRL